MCADLFGAPGHGEEDEAGRGPCYIEGVRVLSLARLPDVPVKLARCFVNTLWYLSLVCVNLRGGTDANLQHSWEL